MTKKKLDPYKTLGIDASATPAEVKSAYRKKAKTAHPDRGGSAEEFNKLTRANIVLSDPAKRSKYDETGDMDDDSPNNPISAPFEIILNFIGTVSAQHAVNGGGDPCTTDLIKLMKKSFQDIINRLEAQKKKNEKIASKIRDVAARLKPKDPSKRLLHRALLNQADGAIMAANQNNPKIANHKEAISMLEEFTFEFDDPWKRPLTTGAYTYGAT